MAIAIAALLGCGQAHVTAAYAIDAAVIEAAKREGEVVWYSTQIINQLVRPVAAAFEKRYPGIKVRYTRANANEVAVKILNENRAGRPQSDVFDGTSTVVPLKREGYVLQWQPDAAKGYPDLYKDPQGYWIASNLFINTPGYNTSLIPKGTQPRTYPDLLDPRWSGKMAWNSLPSTSGAVGFIGTVLAEMGEANGMAYLRAFSKQKVANVPAAARQVLDEVIAGEYAIGLQIFNHHAVISAKKGAPVDWIKMEPSTGTLSVIAINKNAPHPNAAKLFFEFATGPDYFRATSALFNESLRPDVPPPKGSQPLDQLTLLTPTPEEVEAGIQEVKEAWRDTFGL
jgi:iron(III) transport system substrate-binding protein